jgi:polysaccharide biosynthesis protein PslG
MRNRPGRYAGQILLAVAMVAGLAVATPAPARPALIVPAGGYGFSEGAFMEFMPIADVNRELDAVAKTGASWLRILIDWNRIEPVKGQYDWSYVDGLVIAARRHNLKVLGVIAFTPPWARPAGTYFSYPPTNAADYGEFSVAVVRRYGDRVSSWELWNEPNLPQFFGYLVDNNYGRYTELVKAAYPAIKSEQPNSTVVLAGLSRLVSDDYSPPEFLSRMYAAGVKGYFDAAAAHPYVSPSGLAADPENGWSDVGRMRDVMVAQGDGAKKIWMTEIGAPTSDPSAEGVSQIVQAKQITDVLAAAAATGYSGPAFIFCIRDEDTAARNARDKNWGALLTTDWQPKATAAALALAR